LSSPHIRIAGALFAVNPFPGLRPFEPDEDYLFFGREKQTDELLRKLRTTRFLSILGRSGSGKSSLVRSGLIPSLHGGGMTLAGSRWRVAMMRPGEDPMGNLAEALSEPGVLGPEGLPGDAADSGLTRAFYETTLRASQRGLIECIHHARIGRGSNVLVLVDQFEELFRYKHSRRLAGRDEAVAFVKLLLEARDSQEPCYVAITMRADFIDDCMELEGLPEVINDGIYLVPRMKRDELKLAITGPVAVGRATIAPRLVSRLLNDVGDDPDQLPILQHALMRTWERWEKDLKRREPLDLPHYEAIGTMRTALSRHAEEAFGELDAGQQKIAEKLFKTLTDKGSDARGIRRPAALHEICARTGADIETVSKVVDVFRKPGRSFLMPPSGTPLRPDSIVDLSHESLMRIWERLSVWAEEEARSAQLYLSIAQAARRHEEGTAALWRDPELQIALTWREKEHPTAEWAARYDPFFPRAMAFLDTSMAERDREVLEKEERRRREASPAHLWSAFWRSRGR
jgi:energy-coupling factor transporter ATP-binding protein EcfA2